MRVKSQAVLLRMAVNSHVQEGRPLRCIWVMACFAFIHREGSSGCMSLLLENGADASLETLL